MDVPTAITVAGCAIASGAAGKELLIRFLGPTSDYLGSQTKDLVEKAMTNVNRVFQRAIQKSVCQIDEVGQVNPRVFKEVCSEAPFLEDEFAAEYFGGVLASARTIDGKDDSAIPLIHLVKSLSTLQIRLHFTIYATLSNLLNARQPVAQWSDHALSMSSIQLRESISGENSTLSSADILFALRGLMDSNLLSSTIAFDLDDVRFYDGFDPELHESNTISVMPTEKGASLFLRALGLRGLDPEVIVSVCVDKSVTSELRLQIQLPDDTKIRRKKRPQGIARSLKALELQNSELAEQVENLVYELGNLESDLDDVKVQVEELEPTTT